MAKRRRNLGDAVKEEVKLELTPMIDVTFLILIFFMCTLKFKTLEGKLVSYLPTDKGLSNVQEKLEFEDAVIILKTPDTEWDRPPAERTVIFFRNGSNTPFGRCRGLVIDKHDPKRVTPNLDPANTFEEIQKYLNDVRKNAPEAKAKIDAQARSAHFYVVTVLNMMIEAGFQEISYSGIPAGLIKDLQSGEIK
jgi:biopolymer transport protein ExbD